jgi:hypothetical protein
MIKTEQIMQVFFVAIGKNRIQSRINELFHTLSIFISFAYEKCPLYIYFALPYG